MRMKQHRRPKVQRAYLERRLYKTERRIEKFSEEANLLRRMIAAIDAKEKERQQKLLGSKDFVDAGISAAKTQGGDSNASDLGRGTKTP